MYNSAHRSGEPKFNRPGVTDAFLAKAGCHHVGNDESVRLYGFRAEGIAIPFRHTSVLPIVDNGKPFARVRLYHATDEQKYHQRPGTGVHVYIPQTFAHLPKRSRLILIEGEFKALALAEAGYAALGLCGFNGAARTIIAANGARSHALNDELVDLLKMHQPAQVVFLGAADVVLTARFAIEAAKLRSLLFASRQFQFVEGFTVAKLPLDGAKGVDDLRAEKGGDAFAACFDVILNNRYEVPAKATGTEIFVVLVRRECEAVKRLVSEERHEASRASIRLLQSASQLWNETGAPLELKPLLAGVLGVSKKEVAGLVQDAASNRKARTRKADKSNREGHTSAGQDGQSSARPAQWFAEKFPLLAEEYGDAILEETDKEGIVSARDIGEDFFAATLGQKGNPSAPTIFLPTEEKFYSYLAADGVFIYQQEPLLLARLSRLLFDCARACKANCDTKALEFRFRDAANLSGVLRKARGLLAVPHDFFSTNLTEYIPCANGMLRLTDRKLDKFKPFYRRRNKLGVHYDASARCPLFLDTLMRPALDTDELDLLQRWFGLALIGENLSHKIVILTGTAGGGKGTFVRVLTGIIGQMNLASLRPQLLGERFE